jgi:hypothetical protein
LFRAHKDFEVIEGDDSHIDPALEQAKAERERLREQLTQELMIDLSSRQAPPARHPTKGWPGRKPGTGFGAFLDCLMQNAPNTNAAASPRAPRRSHTENHR